MFCCGFDAFADVETRTSSFFDDVTSLDPLSVSSNDLEETYELTVEHLREGYSGLFLTQKKSRIVIESIGEGPFADWNRAQRGKHIQTGDEVLAVNEALDIISMRKELYKVGSQNLKARCLSRTAIEVSRKGRMLGLMLQDMVIEEIKDASPVQEYMNSKCDCQIKPGDFLIEVNGRHDAPCMKREMSTQTVRMVIVHV